MADISQEILGLTGRIGKANEKLIRAQERKSSLQKTLDSLVKDIRAKGYEPSQLKTVRDKLTADLEAKKAEVEAKLVEAEKILNSIPE